MASSETIYHSYAKINWYLDVLRRRRDGYHDIETVFQTVSLCDTLWVSPQSADVTVECAAPGVPSGRDNLAWRAADLLQRHTGCRAGAHIRIVKRIPVAAGLAGGSGNAAAALVALIRLWGLDLDPSTLAALALELGSDVPYCLVGGTMGATSRGEALFEVPSVPRTWVVLVHPPYRVSTAEAFASPALQRNTAPRKGGRTAGFDRALQCLAEPDWAGLVSNRFETAVFPRFPALAEARDALLAAGCKAAALSGSGPTLFGVCTSRTVADRVADRMPWPASVVHTVPYGVQASTVNTTAPWS